MKKIYIILVTAIITFMFTACTEEIDPVDTDELSSFTSETTEETTEKTSVTEITMATTEQEEIILVEPGQRDYEYEKDIVFVGDSLCKGLRVYSGYFDETQVFAEGSVASWSFFDYEFTVNGGQYSGVEAIKRSKPKCIYIWIGMNDARWTSKDTYIENLKKISDSFLKVSPHSKIVIVSITPICSFHKWYDDYANGVTEDDPNERINYLNESTQRYFEGLNDDRYSYLNIHDLLMDNEGYLIEKYHSGDGLHINPYAYNIILGAVAQNKVKADPEYVPVENSFPYIETTVPETTVVEETTESQETVVEETSDTEETIESETEESTSESKTENEIVAETVAE